jgi:hypothetical protein
LEITCTEETTSMGSRMAWPPVAGSVTFAEFIRPGRSLHLPGAPFLLAAGLLAVAFVLTLVFTRHDPAKVAN